jgi:multiple antibiotic resistance protein
MLLVLRFCILAFSALLPVINPLGSALMFLGVVGNVPSDEFGRLARKVSLSTVVFLLIIELAGAAILAFFGISLPAVQVAGGLVLAAMGWQLLNAKDKDSTQASAETGAAGPVEEKIFYPLTFPISAGPGTIVVTLTLSAHASGRPLVQTVEAHAGIALAIVGSGISLLLSYAYAPKITEKISPATVQGILRVIAFVLLCIGVKICLEGIVQVLPK